MLTEADPALRYRFPENERRKRAQQFIQEICKKEDINVRELRSRSRRRRVSMVRSQIASKMLADHEEQKGDGFEFDE